MGKFRISSVRAYRGLSFADRKAERVEYRRRAAVFVNIRKIFKANCGSGAKYVGSELQQRGEHNTVMVTFRLIPEDRKFNLDGVLRDGETADEQLENAVLKIAAIARNVRETLANPDGKSVLHVERQLS